MAGEWRHIVAFTGHAYCASIVMGVLAGSGLIKIKVNDTVTMPAVQIIPFSVMTFMAEITTIALAETEAVIQVLIVLAYILSLIHWQRSDIVPVTSVIDRRSTKDLLRDIRSQRWRTRASSLFSIKDRAVVMSSILVQNTVRVTVTTSASEVGVTEPDRSIIG